jgi:hypothetical protein
MIRVCVCLNDELRMSDCNCQYSTLCCYFSSCLRVLGERVKHLRKARLAAEIWIVNTKPPNLVSILIDGTLIIKESICYIYQI